MLDNASCISTLSHFEGRVSYMYLDTVGKVTVGVGNMLPNAAAAQQLGFVHRTDGSPASADEIQAEFDNVSSQRIGPGWRFYQQFTRLDLPDPAIDALLQTRINGFHAELVAKFPSFDTYPNQACAALLDMAYNLGTDKLVGEYLHFCAAVRVQDWTTAANQCHRNGPNDERNNWTKAQFLAAAASRIATPVT